MVQAAEMTHMAFTGKAGQPRSHDLRRPKLPRGTPMDTSATRNTCRGLRSEKATEERREKRSMKRWRKRREHRDEKNSKKEVNPRPPGAQEPAEPSLPKMKYGGKLKIATLNTKGLKQVGKREEIEKWMHDRDIDVLGLQETHIAQNNKERRQWYTWYTDCLLYTSDAADE